MWCYDEGMTDTALLEGTIVLPNSTDTAAVRVCPDQVFLAMGFSDELADAGWQLAEFGGTKARILVRCLLQRGDGFWVEAWKAMGVHVEIADIVTGVREDAEGRWSIVGSLGRIHSTKWVARSTQVVSQPSMDDAVLLGHSAG